MAEVHIAKEADATVVRTVVRGPEPPSAEMVAAAQADLPSPPDGSRLNLRERFIEDVIMSPQGPIASKGEAPRR